METKTKAKELVGWRQVGSCRVGGGESPGGGQSSGFSQERGGLWERRVGAVGRSRQRRSVLHLQVAGRTNLRGARGGSYVRGQGTDGAGGGRRFTTHIILTLCALNSRIWNPPKTLSITKIQKHAAFKEGVWNGVGGLTGSDTMSSWVGAGMKARAGGCERRVGVASAGALGCRPHGASRAAHRPALPRHQGFSEKLELLGHAAPHLWPAHSPQRCSSASRMPSAAPSPKRTPLSREPACRGPPVCAAQARL